MTNFKEASPAGYIAFGKNGSGIRQAVIYIRDFGLSVVPWPEGKNPVSLDLPGGFTVTLWRYPSDPMENTRVRVCYSSEQGAIVEGILVPDPR